MSMLQCMPQDRSRVLFRPGPFSTLRVFPHLMDLATQASITGMPTSRGRKSSKKRTARRTPAKKRPPKPSIGELVRILFRDAAELGRRADPLDAESWASRILGMSYKMPAPFAAREEFDTRPGRRLRGAAGLIANH